MWCVVLDFWIVLIRRLNALVVEEEEEEGGDDDNKIGEEEWNGRFCPRVQQVAECVPLDLAGCACCCCCCCRRWFHDLLNLRILLPVAGVVAAVLFTALLKSNEFIFIFALILLLKLIPGRGL